EHTYVPMSSIIYLATHPSTPRSIYLFTIPIHPLISPFTPHPPTHASIYSPFHPQIPSPIHSFTHYPPSHLPINPSIHLLSTHPSIHSSINALLPPIPGRSEKPQSAGRARRSQAQGNRGCVGSARRTIN
ncbi:hypothetical protein E2I00_010847, partial [Balaenoptera physalus]